MKITDTKHRLKELLNESGDTQNEMARKTGLTKSAISNYINGTREPRQDAIYKISVAYGVSPSWVMGLNCSKEIPASAFTNEKENKYTIDYGNNKINFEHNKEALELFDRYSKAEPEVREMIEYLLKKNKED